ncbi:MAG TPA: ribosome biogenesis GTPase Der, partial [Caldisericia bacterium]|nr:ribosome biogenesis GTPase Der [Caldisericia bacterium]
MFRIAIVGRPNSGKSTLFNKLIKESKATTFELPGTTRDYIYGEGMVYDKKISFLDTGGISFDAKTDISKKINLQVEIAIDMSDLIIFLIDGSYNNITDEDRKIAKLLHKKKKEVILALNKCDIKDSCSETYLYLELGFGEPIKISSLKNIGLENLLNEIYKRIPEEKEVTVFEKNLPKIAIIGKPNTGKSTLLNSILGYERSMVSKEPGTTRDVIEHIVKFKNKKYLFLDTPGIKKGLLKDLDFYISLRALKALKESDIVLFLISCDNISRTDEHLMSLLLKNRKSGIIIINKLDLIKEDLDKILNEISYRLNEILFYPQVMISALKKINLNLIFKLIDIVYENINKNISENKLKESIYKIINNHSPPKKGKKDLKIYDIKELSKNPRLIEIVVNDKEFFKKDY